MLIGRSLLPPSLERFTNCSLIGFSDGSEVAFRCVLYLRWATSDESEVHVKFVAAKGKVGPIGGNTIPRQELCRALMLARLSKSAEEAFTKTKLRDTITGTGLCLE